MSQQERPLESRTLSSGFAKRTLKNLNFIKNACAEADVHPVAQVINSLLGLLVFPYEKDKAFLDALPKVELGEASDLSCVCSTLKHHLPVPSLAVVKFERCKNLREFFRRVRNSISHKGIEFSGADPDSRRLAEVKVTLKDRHRKAPQHDWEISLTAEDLESLSRYVADLVIGKDL